MSYQTAFILLIAALVVVSVPRFITRWRVVSAGVDEQIAFARSVPAGMVWVSPEELGDML